MTSYWSFLYQSLLQSNYLWNKFLKINCPKRCSIFQWDPLKIAALKCSTKAENRQFFLWRNLHKVFYKQNNYRNVIFKETVEITVKIGQWDLHKVAALKHFTKWAIINSFCVSHWRKPSTRKTAKDNAIFNIIAQKTVKICQ